MQTTNAEEEARHLVESLLQVIETRLADGEARRVTEVNAVRAGFGLPQ